MSSSATPYLLVITNLVSFSLSVILKYNIICVLKSIIRGGLTEINWGWGKGLLISFINRAVAAAKSLQLCPTLCDPIEGSPPGSSIHGIFQARVLEWGAIAFSVLTEQLCFIRQLS